MRILIAEDDRASSHLLSSLLKQWDHEVIETSDGTQAWEQIAHPDAPRMLLLDRMMPGIDGIELLKKTRQLDVTIPFYVILVTALSQKCDVVAGLDAGADDYISKPFHAEELRARVAVGERILDLQHSLADRLIQLTEALDQIETLRGIIPICMHCKKVRNDTESWQQIEGYVQQHSHAKFSHGVCPDCLATHYPEDTEG